MSTTHARIFYVSPLGNDQWSGRYAEPGRKDGPFGTIHRARDVVRALSARGKLTVPVSVQLRAGTYELSDTLVFLPEDSGTAKTPVTYGAYPGEAPVLSGGREITGWTVGELNGKPCWTVQLPEVAAGTWNFTQLFVDGERRPRTRRPAEGYHRFTGVPDGAQGMFRGVTAANFAPGHIQAGWKNLPDVDLVTLQHWFESHLNIEQVDETRNVVRFAGRTLSDLLDEQNTLSRYYIENVFADLCAAGQWYLDRPGGLLYYLPRPGERPGSVRVVAPRLKTLVHFLGQQYGPKVRHVRLENLDFRHAQWRLPKGNPGAVQGAFNVPGAIKLHGAEDCILYGCSVSRISQYAIEVQLGCCRNRIVACRLHDLGGGGVKVNSESPLRVAADSTGAKTLTGGGAFEGMEEVVEWGPPNDPQAPVAGCAQAQGTFTEIADCTIRDAGLIFHSAHGVWIGDCGHVHVHHNEISHMRYSGISSGWTWSYCASHTVAIRLEHNHIHHIGLHTLSDLGAIYTLGLHPGSTIKGNVLHDVTAYGYGGWGIYPDQASSYFRIEDNLVYRTQGGGFGLHYGRDNVVRNNIFALARDAEFNRTRGEAVLSFVAENNIIYNAGDGPIGGNWNSPSVRFRGNVYWRPDGKSVTHQRLPLREWQAAVNDRGSVIADPLFADPPSGDFALRDDSPALALGYRPVDFSRVGPRKDMLQAAACDTLPPLEMNLGPIVACTLDAGAPRNATAGMEDARRLSHEIERVGIAKGKPQQVSLTVENYGKAPARGKVKWVVMPAGAGRIAGPSELSYRLKPGQRKAITFDVVPGIASGHLFVETRPSDASVPPSALMLTAARQLRWAVPRLKPVKIDRVASALSATAPLSVCWSKIKAAEIRCALAGPDLAIFACVNDVRREQGTPPWDGSCLEVFGSSAGLTEIGQVVLVPQTDTQPAKPYHYKGGCKPQGDIRTATRFVEGGYEFSVLVPAELLKIDPSKSEFLLEFSLTTALVKTEGAFVRIQPFGAPCAPASNLGYAKVAVR